MGLLNPSTEESDSVSSRKLCTKKPRPGMCFKLSGSKLVDLPVWEEIPFP